MLLQRSNLRHHLSLWSNSDESTANFDPKFTETDLKDVAVIPGFEGSSTDAANALENGDILSEKDANGKGVAISNKR